MSVEKKLANLELALNKINNAYQVYVDHVLKEHNFADYPVMMRVLNDLKSLHYVMRNSSSPMTIGHRVTLSQIADKVVPFLFPDQVKEIRDNLAGLAKKRENIHADIQRCKDVIAYVKECESVE